MPARSRSTRARFCSENPHALFSLRHAAEAVDRRGLHLRAVAFEIANEVGEDPSTARWVNALPSSDGAGVVRFNESKRRGGSMLDLVIADRISDAYLGEILLFSREWQAGELAYVVAPFARGRGIATDALKLLTRWAFDQLGLQRLQLKADPDNAASQRVAEKAGYQREGLLRSSFVVRGRRSDSVLYSRLPTDASP